MSISIPNSLVEFILLGPTDDHRQLQDSPILGDVWVKFASDPGQRQNLLIEPYKGNLVGVVAEKIDSDLEELTNFGAKPKGNYKEFNNEDINNEAQNISFLEGYVVADLTFRELILVVSPKTKWWINKKDIILDFNEKAIKETLKKLLDSAEDWLLAKRVLKFQKFSASERFLVLTGLILWAEKYEAEKKDIYQKKNQYNLYDIFRLSMENISYMSELLINISEEMSRNFPKNPLVWQVSANRIAIPAISKSILSVKADATHHLFKVDCSEIGWAVLDSGIDGEHAAFKDNEGNSRVKRSFDFKNIRRIMSFSNRRKSVREKNIEIILADKDRLNEYINVEELDKDLNRIAEDALISTAVRWELVEKYIEIKPSAKPYTNHGTHVAGIIGASNDGYRNIKDKDFPTGMCPDILLYDFRVLGKNMEDTEAAVIAALQFIRYLNNKDKFFTIHGANLSLSIPHDVRNFACGRTPVCEECMRLISSGVVVVAAAGNQGYKSFETNEGIFNSYAAFSITDPGNAENVITVGSTHRFWPHTYGISFFSSRGPTGDGRMKPDLVAPGERILSTVPSDGWDVSDGTSMAAPHVSGAAAMIMARYEEFIRDPERIKRILCENATDLGRERAFQGHGMLDVLRAFQSI